jgi:hypothetical protein
VVQYRYKPAFSQRSVSSSYASVYLKGLSPQICCCKKCGETPTKYNTLLSARNGIRKLKTLITTGIRDHRHILYKWVVKRCMKRQNSDKRLHSCSIPVGKQVVKGSPTYPKIRVSRAQYPCMSQTVEQVLKSLHGLGR